MKSLRLLLVAATLLASLLVVTPAFAADVARGPIPSAATIDGVALLGLSEAEARAAIVATTSVPTLASLDIACEGTTRTVDPNPVVSVDVDAMLDEAYASSSAIPFELTVRFSVDSAVVRGWIAPFSSAIDRAAVDSVYAVAGRSLVVTPSAMGRRVDVAVGEAAISAALQASAIAGGAAQPDVVLLVVPVSPSVTPANIGRAILVVLGKYRLHSYNGGGIEKTYRCAIGMRRYSTPRGAFRVIGKQVMPWWNNPGSAWARRMPKRIKPGPRNPLGTRALYLNAPGIRIHGTSNSRSIGRAASHGCIRMNRKDIEALFPLIPVGTPVFIVK
jgi:lipoprotein-anchoring transpeptidase ErfK/SrfK